MKYKIEEYIEHYNEYFRLFAIHAPIGMVKYVGGENGLPNAMASSLESCIEFANAVEDKSATILNSGAGASSWVLRKIFKNVICTDPDKDYLEVVKKICNLGKLNIEKFVMIPEGETKIPFTIDYCYYDYGNIERMIYLDKHIEATKIALYVDDTDDREDCKEYRNFVFKNYSNYKIIDCKTAKDSYGRWGVFIYKN